jgi:N-methylhydantoinase B
MRFSENGYYIEKYVKCANCGLLIYDEGIQVQNASAVYCSDWCIEWAKLRDSGQDYFQLPIVQPTIKTQR